MSAALDKYRELETRLIRVREKHDGRDSEEEDEILDAMDPVWWELTREERDIINGEPPKTLIREE